MQRITPEPHSAAFLYKKFPLAGGFRRKIAKEIKKRFEKWN